MDEQGNTVAVTAAAIRRQAEVDAASGIAVAGSLARTIAAALHLVDDDFEVPADVLRRRTLPPVHGAVGADGWFGWADGARTVAGALTAGTDAFRVGFAGPLRPFMDAFAVHGATKPVWRNVRGAWAAELPLSVGRLLVAALRASQRVELAGAIETLLPLWSAIDARVRERQAVEDRHHDEQLRAGADALNVDVDSYQRALFVTRQLQRLARTEDRGTDAWYRANVPVVARLLAQGVAPGSDSGTVRTAPPDNQEIASWRWLEDHVDPANSRLALRVGPAAGDVGDWRRTLPNGVDADDGFVAFDGRQLPTVSRHFERRNITIALALRIAFLLDSAREDRPDLVALSSATRLDEIDDPAVRAYVRSVGRAIPLPDGKHFREYQQIGVAFAAATGYRCLIGDAPGVGKTAQAIGCLSYGADKLLPALVVCPASVLHNWKAEIEAFAPWLEPAVLEDAKAELPPATDRRVWITSWDLVAALEQDILFAWPKAIIIDESHMMKNQDAKRSASVGRIAKAVPHAIELSGTAMENRVAELWHQLHALDAAEFPTPDDFGYRYRDLRRLVVAVRGKRGSTTLRAFSDTNGADPNAELAHRLRRYMIRRLKSQVLADLPPKVRQASWCQLDPKVLGRYRTAEDETARYLAVRLRAQVLADAARRFLADLVQDQSPRAVTQAGVEAARWANEQIKSGGQTVAVPNALQRFGLLRQLVGEAKVPAASQWIADRFATRQDPLIVFIEHQAVMKALAQAVAKQGLRWTYIDGSVSPSNRQKRVLGFQAGEYDVIIGSRAMHIGLTLHRAAEVLFVERWWVPAQEEQGEDRAHRFGQTKTVQVTYFMARGTVDERLDRIVRRKRALSDAVLGGEVIEGGESLDAGAEAQEDEGVSREIVADLVRRVATDEQGRPLLPPIQPAEIVEAARLLNQPSRP